MGEKKGDKPERSLSSEFFAVQEVLIQSSLRLSNTSFEPVDEAVTATLEALLGATAADHAHWFSIPELPAGKSYAARSRNLGAVPPFPASSELPWIVEQLEERKVVVVKRVDKLPRDASVDQQVLSAREVKSMVLVPASCGRNETGVLVLEHFSQEHVYPGDVLSQLQMVSRLIGLVLASKRVRMANRVIEQQFRNVFEQPLIGMGFADMDGRLLRVNREISTMLGYSQEELLNMRVEQFADPENFGDDLVLFQELRAGGRQNYHVEKAYLRKDGRRIWGRLHVCRVAPTDGGPARVLAMVEDITERKEAEDRLHEAQVALHELTGRLIQAQEEERHRIARELHDDIGQRLSLLMIAIERISREVPATSEPRLGPFGRVLAQLDELTKDVHQLSHQLHSTKLQYIGLRSALRDLCQQVMTQHGIVVIQELEDAPDLPPEVQLCLYRVAQEALNNMAKHSKASEAFVRFAKAGGVARLEIRDSGVGFNPSNPGAGLGLASMSERLRIVGGELAVTSNPGKGTEVVAVVPLETASPVTQVA
jgi:PAS domain S-box-containing protein